MSKNTRRDYRDVIGGALLMIVGAAAGYYGFTNYSVGTMSEMGPGMFPMWLGVTLATLGTLIAIPAVFRAGTLPIPEKRPAFFVLAGVLVFAATVERVGLVPAIFILTVFAALADKKLGILGTIVLAAFLSLLSWLIFLVGLAIPIRAFVWPF